MENLNTKLQNFVCYQEKSEQTRILKNKEKSELKNANCINGTLKLKLIGKSNKNQTKTEKIDKIRTFFHLLNETNQEKPRGKKSTIKSTTY